MAVSLFLHYTGVASDPALVAEGYAAGPGAVLADLAGATSVELYVPLAVDDPLIDDGMGPVLVVQVRFPSLFVAEAALAGAALAAALADVQGLPLRDWRLRYEVVAGEPYAEAGEADPAATEVPVCYLVRYERPADDEAAFIEHYCARHPPLMADLPAIRRCEVYTPLAWTNALPVERADHMLICDTSFATLADLEAALRSEARERLREDYYALPPFSGRVTHHGMARRRLAPRAAGASAGPFSRPAG